MKPTFDPEQALNDRIAECEFMIAYHEVDLWIVARAIEYEDLSPVGKLLARNFVERKLESINGYRECLKQLQTKQK